MAGWHSVADRHDDPLGLTESLKAQLERRLRSVIFFEGGREEGETSRKKKL